MFNKGQKSSVKRRFGKKSGKSQNLKSAISGRSSVEKKSEKTKLSTKICVGITLIFGLVLIIIVGWLFKSKYLSM